MRTVERWNSELDDELLHPGQRMTNHCARSPNHQFAALNNFARCQVTQKQASYNFYEPKLAHTTIGQ